MVAAHTYLNSYLIVGNGNLAHHLSFLFQALMQTSNTTKSSSPLLFHWNYKQHCQDSLLEMHTATAYTLLCLPDHAIESFIVKNHLDPNRCIHFSGALFIAGTLQFHPLMTFSKTLYTLDFYKKIAFIGLDDQPHFKEIFPFLENPYFTIAKDQKGFYHALCVLSGNFTNLLWKKTFSEFEKLSIPPEAVMPYFSKVFENIQNNYKSSLTGPLARKDKDTLLKNIQELQNDPYQDVYKSFVKAYDPQLSEELNL